MSMQFKYDDGGRADAGYKGSTGDCACRAAAIATGRPYQEIYDLINEYAQKERPNARRKRSHARTGVHTGTMNRVMETYGFLWVPTMHVGSGCQCHLAPGEIPMDEPIVARVSKHYVAVIDGVIHDTGSGVDRDGTRCVYGMWVRADTSISGMESLATLL